MFGQPGFQLAIGFNFFLQRFEGFHARRQIGLLARFCIDGLLFSAAVNVQLWHVVLQLVQARLSYVFSLGSGCRLAH